MSTLRPKEMSQIMSMIQGETWEVQAGWTALVYVATRLGIVALEASARAIAMPFPPMKTEDRPSTYAMSFSDRACLFTNGWIEAAFTTWLLAFSSRHMHPWDGALAVAAETSLLFVVDDLLYAPFHYVLHTRSLYRWVHARHHKIAHPSEGYLHASMEHPLEMAGALLLHACAVVVLCPWLCQAAVCAHLIGKAFVACLNHQPRDTDLVIYRTRHHRIHHEKRTVNYAQNVFLFDRVLSTYRDA